jgi:nitroreductase
MEFFETIRSRRSVRSYLFQTVEEDKIRLVLESARLAPSADNRQEWRFVVVKDAQVRQKLSIAAEGQAFVAEAPVVIACCSVESDRLMSCGHPAYAVDLGIAIEHMALAATALGLGSCWIGAFDEARVREILGIPKQVRVVEMLALGYPKHVPGPRQRLPLERLVHRETWNSDLED